MRKDLRFPDFIIGGAPKSGTSSLFFWLAAHPDICASRIKEPYFMHNKINMFNKRLNLKEHGLESYSQLFSHCNSDKLAFEASAGYLYLPEAIDGFNALENPPKIIFLLRNPSSQFYSHFKMQKYRLRNPNVSTIEEYFKREKVSQLWHYSESLKLWLERYDTRKIKIMLFEEVVQNKVESLKSISEFLGVDAQFYSDFDFDHRNESRVIKSSKLHRFGLRIQRYIPHKVQELILPIYLKMNSSKIDSNVKAEKEFLKSVQNEFQKEKEAMEKLLPKLDFSLWSK